MKRSSYTTRYAVGVSAIALAFAINAKPMMAAEIDTGSDVKIRWDNTVKYSTGMRTGSPSFKGLEDTGYSLGADDGNRSFKQWNAISNRVDLLSELNVSRNDFGFRVSGAAWYDDVYNHRHANVSGSRYDEDSSGPDRFARSTQVQQGKNAELQDAFVFGKGDIGGSVVRFRAGRHTLLWGESLFLASNGIAYGQAPFDVSKANSVPNTQAKELFMPVGQLSVQVQPNNNLTLEAYWQPEWRPNRMPASGSYFSVADFLGAGAERFLIGGYTATGFPTNNLYLRHGKDITPTSLTEQFGVGAKFRADAIDTDFGLFALIYNDKSAQVYGHLPTGFPATGNGTFERVYARNIRMYGASASTQVGDWNVGGEVSYRQNTPFLSGGPGGRGVIIDTSNARSYDADKNRKYATGDSLHAQMSGILLMGSSALWDGGSIVGEVGGHRRLLVDQNLSALDIQRSRYVAGARAVFEPSYFQVIPGVDMSVPIGAGYTVGQSPIDVGFNNGAPDRGGDMSIGLKADYAKTWFGSVNYTHYFGRPDQQYLLGHDYVSLSVQRTF